MPKTKTILLVDDEAIVAAAEADIIQRYGYTVSAVHSGPQAIEAVSQRQPVDLILMDINLGRGMDGVEAAREILQLRELPIVFLTHYADEAILTRVRTVTRYGYVLKSAGEFAIMQAVTIALDLFETHRRANEEEQRFRSYVENATDLVFTLDEEGYVSYFSPNSRDILGIDPLDAQGKHLSEIVHPLDLPRCEECLHRLLRTGQRQLGVEHRFRHSAGRWVWFATNGSAVRDTAGRVNGCVCIARDITDRKRAEAALAERNAQLEAVLDNAPDLIGRLDRDHRHLYVNRALSTAVGLPAEQYVGKTIRELEMNPTLVTTWETALDKVFETGTPKRIEYEYPSTTGPRVLECFIAPEIVESDEVKTVVGISRDVTETRRAQQQVANQALLFSAAFHAGPLMMIISTVGETRIIDVNENFQRLTGFTAEEAIGRTVVELGLLRHEDRTRLRSLFTPEGRLGDVEVDMRKKSGESFPCLYFGEVFDAGHERRLLSVIEDITVRKATEQRLHESEQMYRSVVENSLYAVALVRRDGTLAYTNQYVTERIGVAREELVDAHVRTILSPTDAEYLQELLRTCLDEGRPITSDYRVEVDGQEAYFEFQLAPLEDANEAVFVAVDVTEREQARAELGKALEQKNNLLDEVRHRIKNNLAMIGSLINLKAMQTGTETEFQDLQHQVEAIQTVHQMLSHEADISSIDFGEYTASLLQTAFASARDKRIRVENRVGHVVMDAKIAIPLGLIINEVATNAIKHGFTADVEYRFTASLDVDTEADEYRLVLRNNGAPFPEEVGFSSRTTLGLRLIYSLSRQMGGSAELVREPEPAVVVRVPMSDEPGSSPGS
jgi:PAS domain S-box-containing protein